MANIKKFFKKADPVTFALIALLGVSATFAWIQIASSGGNVVPVSGPASDEEVPVFNQMEVPASIMRETFIAPIATEDFTVTTTFFDEEAEDAAALVSSIFYFQAGGGMYSHPSQGTSFADATGDVVDVVAPLSGTISSIVDDHPVRGTVIVIDHIEGVQTVLTGVYDTRVQMGDVVEQGSVLGVTGLSTLEPDAGNVVHMEVMQNDNFFNPEEVIGKAIREL